MKERKSRFADLIKIATAAATCYLLVQYPHGIAAHELGPILQQASNSIIRSRNLNH
jgi:hypothetical protein